MVGFAWALMTSLFLQGEPLNEHYQSIGISPFFNLPVLGSQDERTGFFVHYQAVRPEKRLTLWGKNLKLALETNISYSYGGGWRFRHRDQALSVGIAAIAKYEVIGPSRRGSYFEMGWGLNYASRRTWDLNTLLNSTPLLGAGITFPYRQDSVGYLGLRVFHISNAGTYGSNQGQNQLCLFTAFRL